MAIEGEGPPWRFTPEDAPSWAHTIGAGLAALINADLMKNREGYDEDDCKATRSTIIATIEAIYGDEVLFVAMPNDKRGLGVLVDVGKELMSSGKIPLDFTPPWKEKEDKSD